MSYPTCTACEDLDFCPLGDTCPVAKVAAALGLGQREFTDLEDHINLRLTPGDTGEAIF